MKDEGAFARLTCSPTLAKGTSMDTPEQTPDTSGALSTIDIMSAVNDLCDRFERAWQSGHRPDVNDWIPESRALRRAALVELVLLDLEHRLRRQTGSRRGLLCTVSGAAHDHDSARRLLEAESRYVSEAQIGCIGPDFGK